MGVRSTHLGTVTNSVVVHAVPGEFPPSSPGRKKLSSSEGKVSSTFGRFLSSRGASCCFIASLDCTRSEVEEQVSTYSGKGSCWAKEWRLPRSFFGNRSLTRLWVPFARLAAHQRTNSRSRLAAVARVSPPTLLLFTQVHFTVYKFLTVNWHDFVFYKLYVWQNLYGENIELHFDQRVNINSNLSSYWSSLIVLLAFRPIIIH